MKFLLHPLPDHSSTRRTAFAISRVYSALRSLREVVAGQMNRRPNGLFLPASLMNLDGNSVACEGLGSCACVIVSGVENDAIRNTGFYRSTNNEP